MGEASSFERGGGNFAGSKGRVTGQHEFGLRLVIFVRVEKGIGPVG